MTDASPDMMAKRVVRWNRYGLIGLAALSGWFLAARPDDAQKAAAERFQAYLKQHPEADKNGDGVLTQPEWFDHYAKTDKAKFVADNARRLRLLEDLTYAKVDGRELKLDLYLPTDAKNPPLVVWIHGGGWHSGNKDWSIVRWLAADGYALASVQYRLSDEADFPAQIHDCKAALRWLRAYASEHGYDATRLAVLGESAGGHLAALLGVSAGVQPLEGEVGDHDEQPTRVSAVVDFYGPTDLPRYIARHGYIDALQKLFGKPAAEAGSIAELASPVTHVTPDDAPILILHGTADTLVPLDQSTVLHERYQQAGVESRLVVIDGAAHTGPKFVDSERRQMIKAFLHRHLSSTVTQ